MWFERVASRGWSRFWLVLVMHKKPKCGMPFIASNSRQSTAAHIKKEVTFVTSFFIAIGFQDSCDAFLLAMMLNCWELKAYL